MTKTCEHCKKEFTRSGRPEQRFCSRACFTVGTKKPRPERRCEHCGEAFPADPRQVHKRFCSQRCVALWREREKRLKRPKTLPPRERKAPGRIEWTIFGKGRGRGIAPSPRNFKWIRT